MPVDDAEAVRQRPGQFDGYLDRRGVQVGGASIESGSVVAAVTRSHLVSLRLGAKNGITYAQAQGEYRSVFM